MGLNSKNQKVWDQIFNGEEVEWKGFVSLVKALGGSVKNRSGANRTVRLGDGPDGHFHEPHDGVCGRSMVKRMKSFLEDNGVKP